MQQYLDLIDKVYVVSLASRLDRRSKWTGLSQQLPLLKNKLQIIDAVDGRTLVNTTGIKHGELGCSLSHMNIWQEALANQYRLILVFEDDILLDGEFEKELGKILAELKMEFDWVYLYNTWDYRPTEPFSENLVKVIASLGTQAYVLNTGAVNRILPYVREFRFPIDVVMGHMSFLSRVYRPKKMLVQHNETMQSDTTGVGSSGRITRTRQLIKKLAFWNYR